MTPRPFKNDLAEFTYYRTYSRWVEEKGRRETWNETVSRYMDFMRERLGDKLNPQEYVEIHAAIESMSVMPSMRLMWSAGDMARSTNVAAYNCSFIAPTKVEDFAEIIYLLMCGTGVGFSVERKAIEQLPEVALEQARPPGILFHIEDSREGWANALKYGMTEWFNGFDVVFDYSAIRPAGTRLKRMGGRSSGPEPLRSLLEFTRERIFARRGMKLRPIDVHDIICKIGDTIVMGGVRRSALISLSDLNDDEMRSAKTGRFWETELQRMLANNSAVYEEKPTWEEFKKEWQSLKDSGTGERGIFNRGAARLQMPTRRRALLPEPEIIGTNPCFAPGTLVHTKNGHFPIETLVGKTTTIWDGVSWINVDNFRVTGEEQQVLKITLQDGSEIRATPYHKFILDSGERVMAADIQEGDALLIAEAPESNGETREAGAYLKGFLVGDGTHTKDRPLLWLYETKYGCEDRLIKSASEIPAEDMRTNAMEAVEFIGAGNNRKRMQGLAIRKTALLPWATENKKRLPKGVFSWDSRSKYEFIAGVMDADGTAMDTANGWAYQICSVERKWLLDFQSLLKTIGVQSKLSLMKSAGYVNFDDGYGEYSARDCWRLTISQSASIELSSRVSFSRLSDFSSKKTTYKRRPKWNRVASVAPDGIEDKVYCCTVPNTHAITLTSGLLVGQCGEITLRSSQFCNLTEIVARPNDTDYTLIRKARIAAIIGTYQSSLTDFPYLSEEWKKNCEDERLLGVSITGIWDCPALASDGLLCTMREAAIDANEEYAARFGINPSASITCVKPSGTVSQLVDSSSGMHPRHSAFYIRRIRVSASDPLFISMKEKGVPYSPEVGQDEETATTFVLEFPVKAPEGSTTKDDLTAIQQLEHWKKFKVNFTEHNPSVTISVGSDEWDGVAEWLYANWEFVGGLSFLPRTDHVYELAPYEEITEAEYNELVDKAPKIDINSLHEIEKVDGTSGSHELACVGGACLI